MTPPRWMTVADPIHGIIQLDRHNDTHRLLIDVINSKAFQRLRRIKQMGLAEFVFPGATHSRFLHSLGSLHLMVQTIEHLQHHERTQTILNSSYPGTDIPLSRLLLLGILIHDIGHGPLSHTLEDILDLKEKGLLHDDYWNEKIITEDPELKAIWETHGTQLPQAVLGFMGHGGKKHFLAYLVSSQLDMDRLDYLQRDSHFLGVQYGRIEADRIIANIECSKLPSGEDVVVVRDEALPAIEHYLFGRYQAYKMALHSLDKASESLLKKTLERFCWVRQQGINPGNSADALFTLITEGHTLSTQQYLRMDDCYLWEVIHSWASDSEDALLKQLAERLMQHDLLKFVDLLKYGQEGSLESIPAVYNTLKAHYESRGLSFEFGFDETTVKPKAMYQPKGAREPIWVRTSKGLVDLADASSLPLTVNPQKGKKHLLFVWDREAKRCLTDALDQAFPSKP